ncbi:MAG: pyridoxal-phosphate dependent enzyme [Myxococcota bacterium]|nr:pyridoxal-phosphate dependent enzyme [Myxococcota bacterium]
MRETDAVRPLRLGHYPTPVERVSPAIVRPPDGAELWIKRDGFTHDVVGGNKVRKLEWLLAEARSRGATRLVTAGAAGSHHVLATTYFGRLQGFDVEAVLVPQPRSAHVVEVLRAGIGLGLRPFAVTSWREAVWALARRVASGACFLSVGGSSVVGAMGYVAAARELANQIRAGELPEPDLCVVALGSAGTAAGLAAGFAHEGMRTRVVGVVVAEPLWLVRSAASILSRASFWRARAAGPELAATSRSSAPSRRPRLSVDAGFLGRGYGHTTAAGDEATKVARPLGLTLDPTYTAKAFSAALAHARDPRAAPWRGRRARGGKRIILYWHTLSSAPLEPLLERAPAEADLDPSLQRLLASGAPHVG